MLRRHFPHCVAVSFVSLTLSADVEKGVDQSTDTDTEAEECKEAANACFTRAVPVHHVHCEWRKQQGNQDEDILIVFFNHRKLRRIEHLIDWMLDFVKTRESDYFCRNGRTSASFGT